MLAPVYMVCESADIDTATGACLHPVWMPIPSLLPPLDAAAGVAISVAILCVWALAYGYHLLGRTAEN